MADAENTIEVFFKELQRITRLLVVIATKGQTQREKIETLSGIGFQPKEIADILGTTSNTVRVALVNIRKGARSGGLARGENRHDKR